MKGPSIAASIPRLKLSSGHYIPQVGFGLWKVPAAQTADAVYGAIKAGYRHIDGAYGYANSAEAGQGVRRAIAHGLVSRDDLFITSKLWNNHHAPAHATRMANEELRAWGLDHLDLYLIHFPIATQWVDPSSFLELGNPRAAAMPPLMDVPLVKAIAARHGRTPAQVLLRWCTQRGIVVIPKSMRAERVRENLDCCGFDLEAAELEAISGLDRGLRFNDPGVTHGGSVRIFT
ncbi:Transcriptional activator protein DAL81 [Verticillium dahliae VDG2]|nr:Transcriptional activator protein DAL81 [Verticillium dahliae VDG2]